MPILVNGSPLNGARPSNWYAKKLNLVRQNLGKQSSTLSGTPELLNAMTTACRLAYAKDRNHAMHAITPTHTRQHAIGCDMGEDCSCLAALRANAEILRQAAEYGSLAADAVATGQDRRAYQLAVRAGHYARRGSWDC